MQDCKKWNTEVPTRQFVPHGIGSLQQCGLNPFMKKLVEAMWRRHLAWEFLKVRSSGITPCQSTRRPTNFTFEQRAIMPQDYIYIYLHIQMHACILTYQPTYVRTYMHKCICIHTHTHIHGHMHTHTDTTCTRIQTETHTYIYIHMDTHAYTIIHTHTYAYMILRIDTDTSIQRRPRIQWRYMHACIRTCAHQGIHIYTITYLHHHTYIQHKNTHSWTRTHTHILYIHKSL